MQIFSFEITFATSIKHTTKIMLLVDTTKYHNCKIINTMEKQNNIELKLNEFQENRNRVYRAFKAGEYLSKEDYKTLISIVDCIERDCKIAKENAKSLERRIKRLENVDVINGQLIDSLNASTRREKELTSKLLLQQRLGNKEKIDTELANSLKTTVSFINTILA